MIPQFFISLQHFPSRDLNLSTGWKLNILFKLRPSVLVDLSLRYHNTNAFLQELYARSPASDGWKVPEHFISSSSAGTILWPSLDSR